MEIKEGWDEEKVGMKQGRKEGKREELGKKDIEERTSLKWLVLKTTQRAH